MALSEEFNKFCKDKNITKTNITKQLFKHKTAITIGKGIFSTLADYSKDSNPFVLLSGGFKLIESITSGGYNKEDFFNEYNGWKALNSFVASHIFFNIIKKYKHISIVLAQNRNDSIVNIYTLPISDIGLIDYSNGMCSIYIPLNSDENKIIEFLIKEKFKELNSNNIELKHNSSVDAYGNIREFELDLVPISSRNIKSKNSDYYIEYLKRCNEKSICRSLIFYGPPGTGKTTLAQTIVNELNYKTLYLKLNGLHLNNIKFLIHAFKFEAILIDDFDQSSNSPEMLQFFEDIRKTVKLIIATANTMQNFHPAIIRPDRFDEIIKIDELEESTIKSILGSLNDLYFDKVKKFPVAYLNELVIRNQLDPLNIENHYLELNKRVIDQLEKLK